MDYDPEQDLLKFIPLNQENINEDNDRDSSDDEEHNSNSDKTSSEKVYKETLTQSPTIETQRSNLQTESDENLKTKKLGKKKIKIKNSSTIEENSFSHTTTAKDSEFGTRSNPGCEASLGKKSTPTKSRNVRTEKSKEFSFVTSLSAISTLIFRDQTVNENQKHEIMLQQKNLNNNLNDNRHNYDDLENVQRAAKCIEIIRSHDNAICKEILFDTFKEINLIDFEEISDHNMIDFSILMDYYCLVVLFTLLDKQKNLHQFNRHELNIDHLCNMYESLSIVEEMHKHNVESVILRLEGTNLATIFHKMTKAKKILKIEKTNRDANVKLKSDVTKKKFKKKYCTLYSIEFEDSNTEQNTKKETDSGHKDGANIKKLNAYENCIIRVEKAYEDYIDSFIAFSRFVYLISMQLKIFSISYKAQFENLVEKITTGQTISYKDYPEMMLTFQHHRNVYKQLVHTINSKVTK